MYPNQGSKYSVINSLSFHPIPALVFCFSLFLAHLKKTIFGTSGALQSFTVQVVDSFVNVSHGLAAQIKKLILRKLSAVHKYLGIAPFSDNISLLGALDFAKGGDQMPPSPLCCYCHKF